MMLDISNAVVKQDYLLKHNIDPLAPKQTPQKQEEKILEDNNNNNSSSSSSNNSNSTNNNSEGNDVLKED